MMKCDIILSGVGGQGVLSVAAVITRGAMKSGFVVRQSEVHGMAQRGGAVQAHLRISDSEIESDLIQRGSANILLSMEPLEGLRYLDYLRSDGILITSLDPVVNIPDYPEKSFIHSNIKSLPSYIVVESKKLAVEAGSPRSTNMVMVGAVSRKLELEEGILEDSIREYFSSKGEKIVDINLKAFRSGREAEHTL